MERARAAQVLGKRREQLQIFGQTKDRSACTFAVPFSTQLAVVFKRGVTLMRRNPKARAVELGVAVVKAPASLSRVPAFPRAFPSRVLPVPLCSRRSAGRRWWWGSPSTTSARRSRSSR